MTLQREIELKTIFSVAHSNYEKELKARAFFKVNDYSLSEDIVQKTFMKTWIYLTKGGEIRKMKAFLYHVLNSIIIDEYRKQKCVSLDGLLEKRDFEPSVDYTSDMINELDGKKLFPLIKNLPEKYQRVVHMRYIQDLTLGEISKIIGQSKNTIAVQAHRGLEILRSLYKTQLSYR